MALSLFDGFIGGAYQSRSSIIDGEVLLNAYLETTVSKTATKQAALLNTPGLRVQSTVSQTVGRGGFTHDGRTFRVVGARLYEVNVSLGTETELGPVADDGTMVSFASNGRAGEELAVCSAGDLYILDLQTNVLSAPVALPFPGRAAKVGFLDGYFLLLETPGVTMWFSALEDGTTWDALDFFIRSHVSDDLIGFQTVSDRIWLFGSSTIEVFYDSGDADTPFVPYPGSILPYGLVSLDAQTVQGQTLAWLAQTQTGTPQIMGVAFGALPAPLSTPAVDFALSQAGTLVGTETLAYQQGGHSFVAFTLPNHETWTFDFTEQLWHQRSTHDAMSGLEGRWRARGVCAAEGIVLVGDYQTGDLYVLDLAVYTDAGTLIRRMRRSPNPDTSNQFVFLDAIELGVQAGVGVNSGQGVDPVLMCRISKDAGQTWGPIVTASPGAQGRYQARPRWNRLGRCRPDRLLVEITQTDPVAMCWTPGLYLRTTPGTGQA